MNGKLNANTSKDLIFRIFSRNPRERELLSSKHLLIVGVGSVGSAIVAKSPPDGNTWLLVFDNHGANPFVLPNLPYDTEKDFDPVLFIGTAPYVVSTHPQKPYKTLADVIAMAKAKPDTPQSMAPRARPPPLSTSPQGRAPASTPSMIVFMRVAWGAGISLDPKV